MKLKLTLLTACMLSAASAFAADGQPSVPTPDEVTPGFYGHPLLKEYGYKAECGVFNVSIGQGALNNIDNLVDMNPSNAATTAGLASLTVALDHLVVLKPDPDSDVATKTYTTGTTVGFVISSAGADVSVLDVDVVKMCAIYFYKGDETVAVVNGQNGELDVLNLNVISFGLQDETQKITATCPLDSDGDIVEFDGIGFGFAGVNVGVGKDIAVNYGFIDDFVAVPLIKKYYPHLASSTQGMVTGARNLINNNTEDGATTAILNVGGAYYDVLNDEPFPAGIEVGFAMTSGSLLDLNLGKAVRIMAITYPTDDQGNFLTDSDPIEVDITTQVNVVGLELIGGGKSVVTMMPTVPFFGLRLERISVADVDLGATVVHYAYVKLPSMPEIRYPIEVNMQVAPASTFDYKTSWGNPTNGYNRYANRIYLSSPEGHPVLTKEKFAELYPQQTSYWQHKIIGCGAPWTNINDFICLTLTRTSAGKEEIAGYLYIIKASSLPQAGIESGKYYCQYDKKGGALGERVKLPDPVDGVIDLSGVCLTEDAHEKVFDSGSASTDNLAGYDDTFSYTLYFPEISSDANYADQIDNAFEIAYDEVVVPFLTPEFEIAGPHSEAELRTYDSLHTGKDVDFIRANTAGTYILVDVPNQVDWKSNVSSVVLYPEKSKESIAGAVKAEDGLWRSITDNSEVPALDLNGRTRLLLNVAEAASAGYVTVCNTSLTSGFLASLQATHPGLDIADDKKEYGYYPFSSPSWSLPAFDKESELFTPYLYKGTHLLRTELYLKLNDALSGHTSSASQMLYNQWSVAGSKSRSIQEPGQSILSVAFNEPSTTERRPYFEYTGGSGDIHYARLYSGVTGMEPPYNYSATERGYIPVVPQGFAGIVEPSYIVVENDHSHQVSDLIPSALDLIEDAPSEDEAEYYNLQGIRVYNPAPGLYLRRTGNRVEKILIEKF